MNYSRRYDDEVSADRWIQFAQRAKSTNRLLINTVPSPTPRAHFCYIFFFYSQQTHTHTHTFTVHRTLTICNMQYHVFIRLAKDSEWFMLSSTDCCTLLSLLMQPCLSFALYRFLCVTLRTTVRSSQCGLRFNTFSWLCAVLMCKYYEFKMKNNWFHFAKHKHIEFFCITDRFVWTCHISMLLLVVLIWPPA